MPMKNLPLPILAIFLGFLGVAMFVTKRFGTEFWLTFYGVALAVGLALAALLLFFLEFRRQIRQGRFK
jgi:drug/metabolite transporter (DMT)-like permease